MSDLTTAGLARVFEVDGRDRCECGIGVTWAAADPLVVTIDFRLDDPAETISWTVARDLLIEASKSTVLVGTGDLRARSDLRSFWLWLSNPTEGAAVVEVPRSLIDFVVSESIRACQPGTCDETDLIRAAIDVEMAELLDGAV